jgi:hydroxyacylglutathione hydrolase
MIFEMIKSEGIAHKSYFIGSGGRAAVVDPRRDVNVYLKLAENNGLQISYIFETHRNEDYVIGSLELAEATGSEIYHGSSLEFAYGQPINDSDKFRLGNIELEIIKTPGHTDESISITLKDRNVSGDVQIIFTGDLLFAGETGRIDLYGEHEKKRMAEALYDSIFGKILPLGDHVILCPAHGAGSICGADIREQDYTTTGYEKKTNPSLQFIKKREFIDHKISEELYNPPYFLKMEEYNTNGAPLLCRLPNMKPLSVGQLKKLIDNDVQILDIRKPTSFSCGHIPGSLHIWREGVPVFAGWFLNYKDPIILVDDHGLALDEVRRALVRLGFDNLYGYLSGGFPRWYLHAEQIFTINLWTVQNLRERQFDDSFYLLDVRKIYERKKSYIEGSHHIYVGEILEKLDKIPRNMPIVIYCDAGNKSSIAASILKKEGYHDVTSVLGSMNAWMKAGYPVVRD